MSTGEALPEEPFDFSAAFGDWETPEMKINDELLCRIYENFDAQSVALSGNHHSTYGRSKLSLNLTTIPDGNFVAIDIMNIGRVPLGYYWGGEFVPFEERLDPTGTQDISKEVERLKMSAEWQRTDWITSFDTSTDKNARRLDLGDERICQLHNEHHAYLGGAVLDRLLQWRNEHPREHLAQQKPTAPIYADKSTRAAVRLIPILSNESYTNDYGQTERKIAAHVLSAVVIGAFEKSEATAGRIKLRQSREDIDIAVTDSAYLGILDANDFCTVVETVNEGELNKMIELAESVEELAKEFMYEDYILDRKELGVKVPPRARLEQLGALE